MKRQSQPSSPATPPQLGSRHVVPGVGGGEKTRLFWVLRLASSSSSSQPPTPETPRSARARQREERRPAAGSPGTGDAGAAGGTCGSSWRRRWPRRQERGPQQPRQPQPLRPGQPPPRSPPLMRLPSPGSAAPGGCGSSASQQLFADCSCFKVRKRKGQQPRQARTPHLPARPFGPPGTHLRARAAQGLPSGSLAAATGAGAQRRWMGSLQVPRCRRRGGSGGFAGLELQMLGLARLGEEAELGRREGLSGAGASRRERGR